MSKKLPCFENGNETNMNIFAGQGFPNRGLKYDRPQLQNLTKSFNPKKGGGLNQPTATLNARR